MADKQDQHSAADTAREMGTLGSVGISFVLSIVIGVAIGLFIDRWIGRGHFGFFIFFFLGLAAGVVNVIRASKSIK
jgi:ATP synthase protein I